MYAIIFESVPVMQWGCIRLAWISILIFLPGNCFDGSFSLGIAYAGAIRHDSVKERAVSNEYSERSGAETSLGLDSGTVPATNADEAVRFPKTASQVNGDAVPSKAFTPLPSPLKYADEENFQPNSDVVLFVCPGSDPYCIPKRKTAIVPRVNKRVVNGVGFHAWMPAGAVLRQGSGNGKVEGNFVRVFSSPRVILHSDLDVNITYYKLVPVWEGVTEIDFESVVLASSVLKTVFVFHSSYNIGSAVSDVHDYSESVMSVESKILGLRPRQIVAFVFPTELATALGGEGNFSFGNGIIAVNYSNPPNINNVGGILKAAGPRLAHEIAHELFHGALSSFANYPGCLDEGVADALAFLAGFLPENEFGPIGLNGKSYDGDCGQASEVHDIGNCLFWHVRKLGFLTANFMQGIFHPQHRFDFANCAPGSESLGNTLLVYFTEASGGENMAPVLDAMKIPHAGSYLAAKRSLGL